MYEAIHNEIVDIRVRLQLTPVQDYILSQVERSIFNRIKKILGIPDYP
jgi:hypothetical protein